MKLLDFNQDFNHFIEHLFTKSCFLFLFFFRVHVDPKVCQNRENFVESTTGERAFYTNGNLQFKLLIKGKKDGLIHSAHLLMFSDHDIGYFEHLNISTRLHVDML